jgi:hypothetical protein
MNFKQWLLSEEIYPQNRTATVFHRTCQGCDVEKSLQAVYGILTSDFRAGDKRGCRYGCGLYTTFALESQFANTMWIYGEAVVKFKVTDLDNYLIFHPSVAKSIHGKDYKLSDQLKKLGISNKVTPETDLPALEQELETQEYSSIGAINFYNNNKWIENTIKGIIFRGDSDGYVLLKYAPVRDGTISMLGYAVAKVGDEQKMAELQNNKGWIKSTNQASIKDIDKLPFDNRSKYKSSGNQFVDKLLLASPKSKFLAKKYKTEIENLSNNNIVFLLQNTENPIEMGGFLGQPNINKLNSSDVIELINNSKNLSQILKMFYEKITQDMNQVSDWILSISPDKINTVLPILFQQNLKLNDFAIQNLFLKSKNPIELAKILGQEKMNIINDTIFDNMLVHGENKDEIAKAIIMHRTKKPQIDGMIKTSTAYLVSSKLYLFKNKDEIAKLIIQNKKEELTDDVVKKLLIYSTNKNEIAQDLGSENISKLKDGNSVSYLIDNVENEMEMAQIINKYHTQKTPEIEEVIRPFIQKQSTPTTPQAPTPPQTKTTPQAKTSNLFSRLSSYLFGNKPKSSFLKRQ